MHKSKKLYLDGMTCVSCEVLVRDELSKLEHIENVTVCHKKQIADIKYSGDHPLLDSINKSLSKIGYFASENKPTGKKDKASKLQWFYATLIFFCLYWVYRYFKWIGLLDLFAFDTTDIGYGTAVLLGIVASLSTCLAVIGAVVMSFGLKYKSRGTAFERSVKPHLLFHAGRVGGFFVLGGILGSIGSIFALSSSSTGWITFLVGFLLAWIGLNILDLAPSITRVGLRMPKKMFRYWSRIKESNHASAPAFLGIFSFFLPCGFTQSVQIFAVGSGSFLVGGTTMALFALGTMPVLLSVGIMSSKSQKKNRVVTKKVIGFVILAFAWYTLLSGLAANGIVIKSDQNEEGDSALSSQLVDGVQTIRMDVDNRGFTPRNFNLKKGLPVRWIINGKQIYGCTNEIIIPEYDISKKLTYGENIVEFTPTKSGIVSFSCWMGMVRGTFNVK